MRRLAKTSDFPNIFYQGYHGISDLPWSPLLPWKCWEKCKKSCHVFVCRPGTWPCSWPCPDNEGWCVSMKPRAFCASLEETKFLLVRVIEFQWKSEGETGKLSIFWAPQFLRDSHVSLVLLMLANVFPWLNDTSIGASRGGSFMGERTCKPKKEFAYI